MKALHLMKTIRNVLVILAFLGVSIKAQQFPSQDPGHKENADVAGLTFSVPNSFTIERVSASQIAFMRHSKYDLALFVAIPEKQIDDEYLTRLSNTLVSQLFPKEKTFRWKLLLSSSDEKVSKFQTANGSTKGFNNKRLFQTHYIAVKVQDRELLIGYITELGQWNNDAKELFDQIGVAGMSMPGWYAQAHVLASITGEKYEEINPGTFIRTTIIRKN